MSAREAEVWPMGSEAGSVRLGRDADGTPLVLGEVALGEGAPEIGLQIDGLGCQIVMADLPGRDGAGALGCFRWRRPASLAGRGTLRLRAFLLESGAELAGSPLTLPENPVPQGAPLGAPPGAPQPPPFALWPLGLVGDVAALAPVELANGLWVAVSGKHQRSVQFDMLDQSQGSGPPRRGVRLTTGRVADQVTAHLALPALPAAGEAFELGTLAWLPEATAPAMQVVGELWLTRQANGAFAPLRRLRRVGLFRQPSRVSATVVLSEEERASPGTLWLSVVAKESRGLCVMPPSLAAPDAAAGDRMEDARLEASFHALAEMVRLHGEALAAHPLLPFAAAPVAVQAATPGAHPPTQVVVPVYNGDLVVRDCLRSLRAAATPEMRVLVVDDGSRDFTAGLLAAEFGSDPRFEFLRRDLNRGYTKSINEAVLLTTAPWLVVLNSDTLVPPGWLARLHAAVRARPGTGMAGPLSNAATWQSIPAVKRQDGTWSTNDMIAPRHLAAVQALLDRESERAYPEFPVLNGFCTLIARAVFDRVGRYDEDAFPMGYGEETDLCLRARRAGFRLTVADDGFVFHHKSVSFGSATRSRLTRAGGLELGNKHLGANIGALEQAMQACQPLQRLRTRLAGPLAELD